MSPHNNFIFSEKNCHIRAFNFLRIFLLVICIAALQLFAGCRERSARGVASAGGKSTSQAASASASAGTSAGGNQSASAGASASGETNRQSASSDIKITVTFYPLYIMLLNITDGVEGVELSLLAPANTGCLHDYELTVRDMKAIGECDVLVANGAGMESFMERAISSAKGSVIVAAENFPLQSAIPFIEENAHIWVSPAGAIFEVQQIAQKLAAIDTARAAQYLANTSAYVEKLKSLSKEMHDTLDKFAGAQIITFHEAFPYFAYEFGLELASVIEREPGTAPSAKELAETVSLIKQAQASGKKISLFAEPQYASSAADVIAAETGLHVFMLDPCVTGSITKDAYINAMRENLRVLQNVL